MTRRNDDWVNPSPCPQERTDGFALIDQWRPTPWGLLRLVRCPDQHALRAADRRPTNQDAEVACDAELPGMGDALSVNEEEIWKWRQRSDRRQDQGKPSEGQ